MKHYNIELQVLTPLSVGAGKDNEWVPGADFVYKNGYVYVLDIRKAYEEGVDVNKLTNLFLRSDIDGIVTMLGSKLEQVSRYIFPCKITTTNPIKTFLRTQYHDKPLVAGSSIKGAVRSALFHSLRSVEDKDNASVFGTLKDSTDFMRFLQIGDIELSSTILLNSKIFNLWKDDSDWLGGWKHARNSTNGNYNRNGFNTIYECAEPKEVGYGTITLADEKFDMIGSGQEHFEQKASIIHEGITTLFKAINNATLDYLKKEKLFFENYPADRTDEIEECIEDLINSIPADGSCCVLKMSAGVGFHAVTGDWQYDDYDDTGENNGKKLYKSRKTIEYNGKLRLMGFVKLRPMSSDEVKSLNIMKEKSEAVKAEAEEQRQMLLQQQEEQRRKMSEYDALIDEANQLYSAGRYDDSVAKAQMAAELFPDKTQHCDVIDKCKKARDAQETLSRLENEQRDKMQKPLEEVLRGVSSIGNAIGTAKKWLALEGRQFQNAEYDALLNCLRKLGNKEITKIRSKYKDLAKLVGEDTANRVLADLNVK